jgi:hypothetical protein
MTSRSSEVNAMTLHARLRLLQVGIQTVVVTALVVGIPQPAAASGVPRRIPRVRTGDPSIAALLREGTEHSRRFRQLVDTIDATDGIVYVERGTCRHVRACLTLTMQVAGPNRLLHIIVDLRRSHGDVLASIGHELQHAIEALGDPHVIDSDTMYFFFDRIGQIGQDTFETDAAIQAGLDVLAEWQASTR